MWEWQIIHIGLRLINPRFPHSAVSDNQILRGKFQLPKRILKNIIKEGSNILTTLIKILPSFLLLPLYSATPHWLLSTSWRKPIRPSPTTYFFSSPILSFSALYYVDVLGPSPRRKSPYSSEERRRKFGLAIWKLSLAGWGAAQVRVQAHVSNFLFFYTGSSLNVNFLLPSLVLIHSLLTSMGVSPHDFFSARGLTGTWGLWKRMGIEVPGYY